MGLSLHYATNPAPLFFMKKKKKNYPIHDLCAIRDQDWYYLWPERRINLGLKLSLNLSDFKLGYGLDLNNIKPNLDMDIKYIFFLIWIPIYIIGQARPDLA